MAVIYGVDTDKPITPVDVRDALIACFAHAHSEQLEHLKEDDLFTEQEFELQKQNNVKALIESYFDQVGGDFTNPSKQDLIKVMHKLMEFAAKFRDQDIIKKHAEEMMQLLNKLP